MIDFSDLLTPDRVLADVPAANRKLLFQQLGTVAATVPGVDARAACDLLLQRERLGSTGFGNGIATPHARIDGLMEVIGVFVRMPRPIDFAAIDDLPVDLVFALFSPTEGSEHLKALARVSRALRDADFRAKLRGAGSSDALYALLTGVEARDAA
ncbi:PTS sugar transporter subunit IIA [Sphingomonas sp. PL-96]|uniref:PTS sugar transporter subunit IIA n=1 Tax=Sphingomonas sp. PL-96 TaxID=2887201 RepID=UPI001E3DF174|nr:PTS sugar transporter subunit IIA [Sphingomonas sp. PL-96]MCC2977662.1 PTS sugar transporter subunit IIA [Sphingomonas sp. PL-96]